jgi:hypothetical protein
MASPCATEISVLRYPRPPVSPPCPCPQRQKQHDLAQRGREETSKVMPSLPIIAQRLL